MGSNIDFVSPGAQGIGDTTVGIRVSDSGTANLNKLRPKFFPRKVLESGHAQVFRPIVNKGGINFTVRVTGANVVSEHAQAVEAMIPGFVWMIQDITGNFMTWAARQTVPVDSGRTKLSIHHFVTTGPNMTKVSTGPTTFYAPFIEYGLGGHMHIGPRPFMTDAMFKVIPHWRQAFLELARVLRTGGKGSFREDPYAGTLNSMLGNWRKFLYTQEKRLGDTALIGLGGFASGIRGGFINSARLLGDIQSVVGRAVGARISRRLTGRVTGRLIGIGSHTVFGNTTINTSLSSISGAQRAYNDLAGRAVTKYIDQGNLFGGLGR